MFILQCKCGNELFCEEQDDPQAWQCEICGQWYDLIGTPIKEPAPAYDFLQDPRFMDRDDL